MVVARCCSRPAVLLPAYRQRSVAQPLFCMRSALATPRPRLRQPLRWSHGLWRAPGSQNWQIGLFTGFSRFRYASAYGGFDGSAPRPGPGGAGRDGLATHLSWTPIMLETYCTLGLSTQAKQNDTLATSSAILCFALHRALITRRLQARCHQGAA